VGPWAIRSHKDGFGGGLEVEKSLPIRNGVEPAWNFRSIMNLAKKRVDDEAFTRCALLLYSKPWCREAFYA
jgi:hypothetical protein